MFPHISLPEIIVIGILAIIFFGKDKLPEAAASFGKAFKSFKKEITGVTDALNTDIEAVKESTTLKTKKSKKTAKAS